MITRLQSRLVSSILCLLCTAASSFGSQLASGLQAQTPKANNTTIDNTSGIPSAPMPHSAPEILKLALDMNGLEVPSAQPWHVKLSYDQFDEDGDNVGSGTVEEFYGGPKKIQTHL